MSETTPENENSSSSPSEGDTGGTPEEPTTTTPPPDGSDEQPVMAGDFATAVHEDIDGPEVEEESPYSGMTEAGVDEVLREYKSLIPSTTLQGTIRAELRGSGKSPTLDALAARKVG